MKDKTFAIVFAVVLAVMLVLTIAHVLYVAHAYENASIIRFIGEELW